MENKFPCTGCGACCKRIKTAIENVSDLRDETSEFYFPYGWNEKGESEKLMADNKCGVYEDRPLICNMEKLSEKFDMSRKRFFEINKDACNTMMDEDGIDEKFRIG